MRLSLKRSQRPAVFTLAPLRFGGGILFSLSAKLDLSEEERHLIDQYHFENALLVESDTVEELRSAFRVSLYFAPILWVIVTLAIGWLNATIISAVFVPSFTFYYYTQTRERLYVRDLMHGKMFRCYSIVELVKKEAYIAGILSYLRQVLETARNWDEAEAIEIAPLTREDAKALVAR